MTDSDATAALVGSDYAHRSREMIHVVKDLRALGADAEVDLPRIAVIGNQSAGKSSLIEAIANIKVPRAAGTCTRCPMEFRLSYSAGTWSSQISLRFEKSKAGTPLPNVQEQKFGPVIQSKNELKDMLRRAQMAVLNPSTPAVGFENADVNHKSILEDELSFSPNVVCVDVSGPKVPDLSFIDLLGLVSNEERNVIDLVRNLILDHITGNPLILLTITMRDDIQNQSAALLAKEVDPQGLRTVGVLTKPDTLQPGEESGWLDILQGRNHRLHHGYFVTKQPGPEELLENLAHVEARKREASYFASTVPWRNVLQTTKSHVGVPHLTSKLLTERISEALPGLRRRCLESVCRARYELSILPDPPTDNTLSDLLRLIGQFEKSISDCVGGSIHEPSVMQHCRATYALFRENIKATTPEFTVNDTPHSSLERPRSAKDVQSFINNHITRELPFDVPFDAKAHLIHQCLEDWPHFVEACADAVFLRLGELLDVKIEQTFGRFTKLKEHVRNVVNELMNDIQANAAKHLQWLLAVENYPFTLNAHYLESYREKYLKKYEEQAMQSDENDQPAESASPEIVLMAEVRAYFQVAYKRIIDNVPRAIDYDGLIALSSRVNAALVKGLGVDVEGSASRLKEYFAEDPEVAELRAELQAKQKQLEEITNRLSDFAGKPGAGRVSTARSSFRLNAPQDTASPPLPVVDRQETYASERKNAVESALESLLNQVTPENLDTISVQILAWANSPEDVGGTPLLLMIISAVVRKSIAEVAWVTIGARICEKLTNGVGDHVKGMNSAGDPLAGSRLVSPYVIRQLNMSLVEALFNPGSIEERKVSDFSLAAFIKELLETGILVGRSLLLYVQGKFPETSTERGMELCYAILKSCGHLLDVPLNSVQMQNIFNDIEQRMVKVSPHLRLMLQELIDLRRRNWMDSPDDDVTVVDGD